MSRAHQLLPWGLVLLLLGWASYGVWPVTPVEGDEQGVIFGVEGMVRGDDTRLLLRYKYDVQPGSFQLLAALTRVTGAPVETVFSAATIAGALGFALAGAWLLRQLLSWPLGWTMAAMLWCQEVTAAACYSNTSAMAGGIVLLAVGLAPRPQALAWLWPGLALAVSGWLRADSLLVAPACLALAYWQWRAWKPAILRTTAIAITAAVGVALLYWASGTSLLNVLGVYQTEMGAGLTGWRLWVETPVQILSPALMLGALLGCGCLAWRREHALGLVVLGGSIACLIACGGVVTTPKYLYFLVPFALLPALYLAGLSLRHRPQLTRITLVAVLLGDALLGLRTLAESQRFFTTSPTVSLARITTPAKTYALVVGPGELIPNSDGFRVRTGQFFAPLCWHREKQRMRADLAAIRAWLATGREQTIFWSGWLALQVAQRELLAQGFSSPEQPATGQGTSWRRDDRIVRLAYLGYAGSAFQAPRPAPASTTGTATYFIGDCANFPLTELADDRRWHLLSAVPEGLITLYQRR